MQKVLIVGINSFLAAQLVNLLRGKFDITGIHNSNTDNLPEGIPSVQVDQLDKLNDEYAYVFVISAFVPDKNNADEQRLFDVNVRLTQKLIGKFVSARFILASSVSVYGKQTGIIEESTGSLSANTYGLSKLWAEELVRKHHSYAILRISSMYGPGMKTNTFLPIIINNAVNKDEIAVYGDGSRKQNYIHVNDVAQMLSNAAICGTNFTGLAVSRESVSNMDVANLVKGNLDGLKIVTTGEDKEISYEYKADYTYKILNFIPTIKLNEGIIELLKWIKR